MIKRVRLIFKSVSEIVGTKNIGLLVLTDSAEMRQVVLPCDERTLQAFAMRIKRTPMVDKLLPEVLANVVQWQTELRLEVHIDRLRKGKYQAVLSNEDTLDEVPIMAADGVLLSFVTRGDIPVMMAEELFMRQSTVYDEMLQSALDKAIKNENYEMASDLRDEMNRRKKQPRGDVGGVEAQNGKE